MALSKQAHEMIDIVHDGLQSFSRSRKAGKKLREVTLAAAKQLLGPVEYYKFRAAYALNLWAFGEAFPTHMNQNRKVLAHVLQHNRQEIEDVYGIFADILQSHAGFDDVGRQEYINVCLTHLQEFVEGGPLISQDLIQQSVEMGIGVANRRHNPDIRIVH
jgi:hypothetical protein